MPLILTDLELSELRINKDSDKMIAARVIFVAQKSPTKPIFEKLLLSASMIGMVTMMMTNSNDSGSLNTTDNNATCVQPTGNKSKIY